MIYSKSRSVLQQAQRQYLRPTRILLFWQSAAFARLLSSLAVLEQREGQLQNASLGAVTAASKLGGSITGLVAGSGINSVAEAAAKVNGLDKVMMIENGAYDRVFCPFCIV